MMFWTSYCRFPQTGELSDSDLGGLMQAHRGNVFKILT